MKRKSLPLGFTWYGKGSEGTGLSKCCKYLLLSYALEKLDMCRVEFRAEHRNSKSIAAMMSIGCIEEVILRSNGCTNYGERRTSDV